jgi:hypothetical protein
VTGGALVPLPLLAAAFGVVETVLFFASDMVAPICIRHEFGAPEHQGYRNLSSLVFNMKVT